MIDWDEIASTESVCKLRAQVRLLTRLVERLGDELNEHNDNHEAHRYPCNVILGPFTLAGQRWIESPPAKEATDGS